MRLLWLLKSTQIKYIKQYLAYYKSLEKNISDHYYWNNLKYRISQEQENDKLVIVNIFYLWKSIAM